MTASGVARIPRSTLSLGRRLGDGGQGTVWEVEKRRINKIWPVAYKEYKPDTLRQLEAEALERMVAFLPAQPAAVGKWLATNTAWPAALVTEGRDVRGFLMRQIPDEFFLTLPSGDRKTAGFEFLLNSLSYVDRMVGKVSPRQVMGLLLALADTLNRLHGLGVVAGDLSPKNLLFTLAGPRPGCFLIDCDAMGLAGGWALKPPQTPDWELPGRETPGTPQGDVYKFALLAVRLFLHEQHGQDPAALRRVDRETGDLAARGLSGAPSDRPALADWLDPLRRAADTAPDTWPEPARQAGGPPPANRRFAGPPNPGITRPGGTRPAGTHPGTSSTPGGMGAPGGGGSAPWPVTTPGAGGRALSSTAPAPRRSRTGRAIAEVVVVLTVLLVTVMAYLNEIGGGGGGQEVDMREEQVKALGELLAENADRRSGVADSVQSMIRCTGLQSARQVFVDAADARGRLVEELDRMNLDELPDGLAAGLRTAWKSSEEADRAYARVVDEVSGTCTSARVTGSAAWQDAADASTDATRAKKDVVALWNPLARQYGLTTLVWSDL
ncbi:hypothetical protein SUDANB58_02355 [Streptomyces sp. enrichment culture]|uniref:hypothetical protein n=1 Tax=Streptomyces sp. enrichment culture TaxID=1795815 RepID=UPI003F557CB5